jgi:predicted dehydrogenase/threonine dehydrogenase-like Zn-dependent dehydrogenase
MKQLTQKLKDGDVQVVEVPWPVLGPGQILVQNHFSVISGGTEGSTVSTARKSLIGKAKERPQQAKQVVEVLQSQGPVQTYRAVMKKLNSYSVMGYSSSGIVIDVAPDVKGFHVGDKVACAGVGYANHAEVVSVPQNLCVQLPKEACLESAAYNTLGAIALQGIRQADFRLGETCLVIGLGLIGQLTCLLLRCSGVRVIGVDLREDAITRAANHCADHTLSSQSPNISQTLDELTNGIGADGAIITAGTSSTDPVNLAGACLRKRGRVVVVGAVSTDFERKDYYLKELELRMSCSYGPGRYDPNYEELGHDYPAGYVRWTEKRNMEAFQALIHSGKIDLDFLTTHRFSLDEAPSAYDIILGKESNYCGIIIRYNHASHAHKRIQFTPSKSSGNCRVGFIGAGSYAMNHLLPNVAREKDVTLTGVMTARGTSSRSVAERFGFDFCTSEESDLFDRDQTNTLFIATRHDSHARYTIKALEQGQNVFVEKPLCLAQKELEQIRELMHSPANGQPPYLMVGFNRRFSSLTSILIDNMGQGPMSMTYRVNAGPIDSESWIQVPEIGGGRIIGEACHFIDYLAHINGSLPAHIFASALTDPETKEDNVHITIQFENGSVGTVIYIANGSKQIPKEHIEIHRNGKTAIIDDFRKITIHGPSGKPTQKKLLVQDKGQAAMVSTFLAAIKKSKPTPISFNEIYRVMKATFLAISSLRTSKAKHFELASLPTEDSD